MNEPSEWATDTLEKVCAALFPGGGKQDRQAAALVIDREVKALSAEGERLQSDVTRQMNIANEYVNEVKALREALEAIQAEAERENGSWVHLKRCIAVQARAAINAMKGSTDVAEY